MTLSDAPPGRWNRARLAPRNAIQAVVGHTELLPWTDDSPTAVTWLIAKFGLLVVYLIIV